jgi:hypothetical protein
MAILTDKGPTRPREPYIDSGPIIANPGGQLPVPTEQEPIVSTTTPPPPEQERTSASSEGMLTTNQTSNSSNGFITVTVDGTVFEGNIHELMQLLYMIFGWSPQENLEERAEMYLLDLTADQLQLIQDGLMVLDEPELLEEAIQELRDGLPEPSPEDIPGPSEGLLTEESVFDMLSSIMQGTQGIPEDTVSEVLQQLQDRNVSDPEQFVQVLQEIVAQSFDKAQEIVDTIVNDPQSLEEMQDPGELTKLIIEQGGMQFAGATPTSPITTVGGRTVIRGGAGVTIDIGQIIAGGGDLTTILENIVPYIPGVSLPSWIPTAGVIFLPTIGEAINKVNEIAGDIVGAIEEGESIGEILSTIGGIIVGAGGDLVSEVQEEIDKVIGQVTGAISDPTQAGVILGGILSSSFRSS